jgi:uncharacterized protein (TIGR01732 family)
MMKEFILITVLFLLLVMIGAYYARISLETEIDRDIENQKKIELCEKELPRNQTCELIAVEKQSTKQE